MSSSHSLPPSSSDDSSSDESADALSRNWMGGYRRAKDHLSAASDWLMSGSQHPEVSDAILRKPTEKVNAQALAGVVRTLAQGHFMSGAAQTSTRNAVEELAGCVIELGKCIDDVPELVKRSVEEALEGVSEGRGPSKRKRRAEGRGKGKAKPKQKNANLAVSTIHHHEHVSTAKPLFSPWYIFTSRC